MATPRKSDQENLKDLNGRIKALESQIRMIERCQVDSSNYDRIVAERQASIDKQIKMLEQMKADMKSSPQRLRSLRKNLSAAKKTRSELMATMPAPGTPRVKKPKKTKTDRQIDKLKKMAARLKELQAAMQAE